MLSFPNCIWELSGRLPVDTDRLISIMVSTHYAQSKESSYRFGMGKDLLEVRCLHLQRYFFPFPSVCLKAVLTIFPLQKNNPSICLVLAFQIVALLALPASHAKLLVYFPNICSYLSKILLKLWDLLWLFLVLPMLVTGCPGRWYNHHPWSCSRIE